MTVEQSFLALVRAGIGHLVGELPEVMDWESIGVLAEEHGLPAIVWDGVDGLIRQDVLTGERAIPRERMHDWFGTALYYEQRYEAYQEAIASLAEVLAAGGLRMMVLKGYALSLDYPVPAHRPCGDIDIWNFGRYQEADSLLAREHGVKVDDSHHHHTVFSWRGFSVENHYDIVNVHAHRSSAEMEKIFKELAQDDSCFVDVSGVRVYLPSANFHALFLLRHALSHFASTRGEIRVKLRRLHIEGTSFLQLCQSVANDEDLLKEKIIDIVMARGKLHNPITDTGGVLYGEIEEIDPAYENTAGFQVGDEVFCNASGSSTAAGAPTPGSTASATKRVYFPLFSSPPGRIYLSRRRFDLSSLESLIDFEDLSLYLH